MCAAHPSWCQLGRELRAGRAVWECVAQSVLWGHVMSQGTRALLPGQAALVTHLGKHTRGRQASEGWEKSGHGSSQS